MSRRVCNRSFLSLLLLLAGVLLLLTVLPVRAAPLDKGKPLDEALTVADVDFLGLVTFPTGYQFAGTEVGGLSSIVHDPRRDLYYTLSDDQGQIDDVRFYTLAIDLDDPNFVSGDVTFLDVTTLLAAGGEPFAPGTLDPEGLTLGREGFLFMSSEGNPLTTPPIDPFVRRYNLNGKQTADLPVPDKFLPGPEQGVRFNLAFESLSITPNGRYLFTAVEGALLQDGPVADIGQESLARILKYDARKRRPLAEYVYVVNPVAEEPVPPDAFRVNGLVELLALDNNGTFLALERSFSVGADNTVWLYEVKIGDATNVAGIPDLYDETTGAALPFEPVEKRLLLNFADLGFEPDNLEGLAFGPVLPDGRQTLIVVSDNNFLPSQTTQFIALALELEPED